MIKFTPITTRTTVITARNISNEMESAMRDLADKIIEDLLRPTKEWEDKPSFVATSSVENGKITMEVLLAGESEGSSHYAFVDLGTKEHDVSSAEKHSKLRMPGTFSAKTIPGTFASNSGSSGDPRFTPIAYPLRSGIEARRFSEMVADEWEEAFPNSMVRLLDRLVDKV